MAVISKGLYRHEAGDAAAPAPTLLNRLADSLDAAWVAYVPAVSAETGVLTTVAVGSCRYKRIGSRVDYTISVTITTAGTGSGALIVSLPFSAVGTDYGAGREPLSTGVGLTAWTNGSQLRIMRFDNASMIANGRRAQVTISYETAAA